MKAGLAVMVKNPGRGDVKTRLARSVGVALAREFYLLCLECLREDLDWMERHTSLEVVICPFSGEDVDWCRQFWGGHPVIPQPLGDLSVRLNTVDQALRRRDFEATILIGSDAPTLPPTYLLQCVEGLSRAEAILGPTEDGGFYALVSRRLLPTLGGIPWSAATTCAEVYRRLVHSGLTVDFGPSWYDVDEGPDLYRLRRDLTGHNPAGLTSPEKGDGLQGCPSLFTGKPISRARGKLQALVAEMLQCMEEGR